MSFKYLDADKMRIACVGGANLPSMAGRILAGVPDPDSRTFVGVIKDVTSDCLKAVVDKVEREDGQMLVVTQNDKPMWEITVRRIGELN